MNWKKMRFRVKKSRKSFGSSENSRTFAPAKRETPLATLREALKKEFFERFTINRQVVQEAGGLFSRKVGEAAWVEETSR